MSTDKAPEGASFWRTGWGAALCILLAAAAPVLVLEHRVHALQWLPYALLLACPLLHFFMHRDRH